MIPQLWLSRDMDGTLVLWAQEPHPHQLSPEELDDTDITWVWATREGEAFIQLDDDQFPELLPGRKAPVMIFFAPTHRDN